MSKSRQANSLEPETDAQTRGEVTRARIIEAAHALFLHQGFHGTSLRQIADEAGIAVGGIYNHFDTKEDLFAGVLDTYHPYRAILPELEAAQGETVEAFVRDATGRARAHLEGAEARLVPLMMVELVEFQGRHLRKMVQTMLPTLLGFVQRFSERKGKLRAVPLPVVLRTLISLMVGYLLTSLILRDAKLSEAFRQHDDQWFDGMIDIYLHGILADREGAS
jgi:AcrR family transcriptional regulator